MNSKLIFVISSLPSSRFEKCESSEFWGGYARPLYRSRVGHCPLPPLCTPLTFDKSTFSCKIWIKTCCIIDSTSFIKEC